MTAPDAAVLRDRTRGALLGLAIGDALGTTLEFAAPGSFAPLDDLVGGGPFRLPAGAWTDDTSMALCLADSLVARGGFDPCDQLARYTRWWLHGERSATGDCFDIGMTVRAALQRYRDTGEPWCGSTDPATAGNGSLMRLAPVVLAFAAVPRDAVAMAAASSRTTHAAPEAVDCCRYLAALVTGALHGHDKDALLAPHFTMVPDLWRDAPLSPHTHAVAGGSFRTSRPTSIRAMGYAVKSLEAALWAFERAIDFRDGALRAVNLGEDADTVGAIYGQLAGAYWGESGLPADWRARLVDGDAIAALADALFALAWAHRFPDTALPPLDPALAATYHDTHFARVDAAGRRVAAEPHDQPPAPAQRPDWDLPASFHVVTAADPQSQPADPAQNAAANARLEAALRTHGAELRPIDATSADGTHAEPSFAVWGVPAGTLARLARAFEQNAFFEIVEHRRGLGAGLRRPGATARWLHVR